MIPKKIHYCWFGGNPLPEDAKLCLESWKKYCPDYQIVEWNEKNFDVYSCRYAAQAYEANMWAFVSDYARIKIKAVFFVRIVPYMVKHKLAIVIVFFVQNCCAD